MIAHNFVKLLKPSDGRLVYEKFVQLIRGFGRLYKLAYHVYKKNITANVALDEIEKIIKNYYDFSLFKIQVNELFKTGDKLGFYNWSGIKKGSTLKLG